MNESRRRIRRRATVLPLIAAAGIGLAGCGSNGYGATASTTSTDSGGAETIATSSGPMGTFLTADGGRAVYLWQGDTGSSSNCNGACASVWPPVKTTGAPKASGGAMAADLGTTKRADGTEQVTYNGHPLYYFASDSGSSTSGEGSNGFGAKWWLVDATGNGLTNAPSSSPAAPAGGGGGYHY